MSNPYLTISQTFKKNPDPSIQLRALFLIHILMHIPLPLFFLKLGKYTRPFQASLTFLGYDIDQRTPPLADCHETISHYWCSYKDFTHPHTVLVQ